MNIGTLDRIAKACASQGIEVTRMKDCLLINFQQIEIYKVGRFEYVFKILDENMNPLETYPFNPAMYFKVMRKIRKVVNIE